MVTQTDKYKLRSRTWVKHDRTETWRRRVQIYLLFPISVDVHTHTRVSFSFETGRHASRWRQAEKTQNNIISIIYSAWTHKLFFPLLEQYCTLPSVDAENEIWKRSVLAFSCKTFCREDVPRPVKSKPDFTLLRLSSMFSTTIST